MTRPDLAWSYSELSKYVQFPGIAHMEAAEHVLRYLRDTWNESITYTRGSRKPNELWGWVDADWTGDTDTRRSHTSYILMMNGRPISCKSRRQDNVSFVYFRSRIRCCKPRALYIVRPSRSLPTSKTPPLKCMKIIWHV